MVGKADAYTVVQVLQCTVTLAFNNSPYMPQKPVGMNIPVDPLRRV